MSIAVARKAADKLLREYGKPVPLDLEDLLGWRGLAVESVTDWPAQLCACYLPSERKVRVNGNHALTRQRFSLAHELGHFILGHEQIDIEHGIESIFGDETETYKVVGDLEREANVFAASLLMPKLWVLGEQRGRTLRELADRIAEACLVSPPAAWYRLMDLRLVSF